MRRLAAIGWIGCPARSVPTRCTPCIRRFSALRDPLGDTRSNPSNAANPPQAPPDNTPTAPRFGAWKTVVA